MATLPLCSWAPQPAHIFYLIGGSNLLHETIPPCPHPPPPLRHISHRSSSILTKFATCWTTQLFKKKHLVRSSLATSFAASRPLSSSQDCWKKSIQNTYASNRRVLGKRTICFKILPAPKRIQKSKNTSSRATLRPVSLLSSPFFKVRIYIEIQSNRKYVLKTSQVPQKTAGSPIHIVSSLEHHRSCWSCYFHSTFTYILWIN
jgi:hypothetical protein